VVKKSSLFSKIVHRWRTSPVRIDSVERRGTGEAAPNRVAGAGTPRRAALPERPEPAAVELPAEPLTERVAGRKLSPREEALLTMDSGLKELATLMRGMQARAEVEGQRIADIAGGVSQLPALGQMQLDLLRGMAAQLERQNAVGETLATTFTELPAMLKDLRAAVERTAVSDERTARSLSEFRESMDRIQVAMGEMVGEAREQGRALQQHDERAAKLAESVAAAVRGESAKTDRLTRALEQTAEGQAAQTQRIAASMTSAVSVAVQDAGREVQQLTAGLERQHAQAIEATNASLESVRRAHEDHAVRLGKLVEENAKWSRGLLGVMIFATLLLLGILAALLSR
jgi:hypothetical protein